MPSVRVVTAELPRILNEIISSVFETAGDIEIIASAASRPELVELLRQLRPDVVITTVEDANPETFGWNLFLTNPLLRILGIGGDGRQTFVYELRPHQEPLGELSPGSLVAAVRRMAATRWSLTAERDQ